MHYARRSFSRSPQPHCRKLKPKLVGKGPCEIGFDLPWMAGVDPEVGVGPGEVGSIHRHRRLGKAVRPARPQPQPCKPRGRPEIALLGLSGIHIHIHRLCSALHLCTLGLAFAPALTRGSLGHGDDLGEQALKLVCCDLGIGKEAATFLGALLHKAWAHVRAHHCDAAAHGEQRGKRLRDPPHAAVIELEHPHKIAVGGVLQRRSTPRVVDKTVQRLGIVRAPASHRCNRGCNRGIVRHVDLQHLYRRPRLIWQCGGTCCLPRCLSTFERSRSKEDKEPALSEDLHCGQTNPLVGSSDHYPLHRRTSRRSNCMTNNKSHLFYLLKISVNLTRTLWSVISLLSVVVDKHEEYPRSLARDCCSDSKWEIEFRHSWCRVGKNWRLMTPAGLRRNSMS
eukprot:m.412199 g.412199  ORF g.412199 m.412199 type:complete len:394 (+) comp16818_c0_seq7:2778-3959(+)